MDVSVTRNNECHPKDQVALLPSNQSMSHDREPCWHERSMKPTSSATVALQALAKEKSMLMRQARPNRTRGQCQSLPRH